MPAAAPFRKVILSSTDDFPVGINDKIKQWVECNGGSFTREISCEVTHLLATENAFKRNVDLVRQAKKLRKIKIVTYDWLEDSLHHKPKKALPTTKYEHAQLRLKKHAVRKIVARAAKENDKAKRSKSPSPQSRMSSWLSPKPETSHSFYRCSSKFSDHNAQKQDQKTTRDVEIERYATSLDVVATQSELDELKSGYHLYRDSTGFEWSVNLVRKDILQNRLERHRMKVRYAPVPFASSYPPGQCTSSHHLPSYTPLFYFPRPYPFSAYPCISSQLPKHLKYRRNPDLRVPIPNPWAQCAQILESDVVPHTYTAFSKYLNRLGDIETMNISQTGSSLELAMLSFQLYFKNRCGGIEWHDRSMAVSKGHLGVDGAMDVWAYEPPQEDMPWGLRQIGERPSVTMVVSEELAGGIIDARAVTPESGW